MKRSHWLLLFFFLAAVVCYGHAARLRKPQKFARIVGGREAYEGEFPWVVSLQVRWIDAHFCGGSILDPQWILTAGHCSRYFNASTVQVAAGEHERDNREGHEQVVRVESFYLHPNFTRFPLANDLALVRLATPLQMDYHVRPIPLPKPGQIISGLCVISGWGSLEEGGKASLTLRSTRVHVTPCAKPLRRSSLRRSRMRSGKEICAGDTLLGGQDACAADSGGPLACRDARGRRYVAGVVSWGNGCGRPEHPGVYADVTAHLGWIRAVMAQADPGPAPGPPPARVKANSLPSDNIDDGFLQRSLASQ